MSARDTSPLDARDAEEAVVAACLMTRAARDAVRGTLRPAECAAPAHGELLDAMFAMDDRGALVDPLTLAAELTARGTLDACGGREYIGVVMDAVLDDTHAAQHAALVRAAARRRELAAVGRRLVDAAHDPAAPVEAAAADAQGALLPLGVDANADTGSGAGYRPLRDVLWPVMETIEARVHEARQGRVPGLATGYPELDALTAGFRPGELVVIGAVPKAGKTALALNILLSVVTGAGQQAPKAGGIVSAEMLRDEAVEALLAALSGVPRFAMAAGTMRDDDFPRLARAAGLLSGAAPLHIDDEAFPSLDDVIARALHLKATHPDLSLLVVDYLQLVTKRVAGQRGDEEIATVCRGLKGLAKRLGIPIIAPAQVNYKEVEARENKRPTLRDLQGGSAMAQQANFVFLLYRERMYTPYGDDTLEVDMAATRRTDRGLVTLAWDGARMRVGSPRLGNRPPYAAAPTLTVSTSPVAPASHPRSEDTAA